MDNAQVTEDINEDNTVTEDIAVEDISIEETAPEVAETPTAEDLVKELNDKLLRNMAEFDNFRKRSQKEKANMYDMGVTNTLEKLLPVVDNFERAMASMSGESEVEKGVTMIYRQFQEALESMGMEAIDCVGQPFDANRHNAVASGPETGYEPGQVTMEMQRGYTYKEKVVRHSMVKVAE